MDRPVEDLAALADKAGLTAPSDWRLLSEGAWSLPPGSFAHVGPPLGCPENRMERKRNRAVVRKYLMEAAEDVLIAVGDKLPRQSLQ